MSLRGTAIAFTLLALLLSLSCIKRADRPTRADYSRFFPLADGDFYIYSGPLGKSMVTQSIGELYTFTHFDSSGNVLFWKDFLKTDHSIGWKNIAFSKSGSPDIHFEPALPFLPWTDQVGDTLLFSSAEIHDDSLNTHLHLQIEYSTYGIAAVTTPAGHFSDCIEIKMTHKALYDKDKNYLRGDSYWWFARNVGIVKYIIPEGTGELLQAKVDGRTYP